MNEQISNPDSVPVQPSFKSDMKVLGDKVKAIFSPLWLRLSQSKLFANKKLVWLFGAVLGLVVLTIIVGLIFGKGAGKSANGVKIPTPAPEVTPAPTTPGDPLTQIERSLTDLDNQIKSLDVKQSRLQPPALDFKTTF